MAQSQVDFNNPANYENCSKKNYEIYVCMPPKNTIVINKFEQADVVKQLNGKTYFTVEDIEKLQKNNPQMVKALQQLVGQGRAYAVTDKTPFVLCGTVGELSTIGANELQLTYTFIRDGQPLQINQNSLNDRLKNAYLPWTLIRTSANAIAGQLMACFVPKAQKGQIQTSKGMMQNINGVGVEHGLGDFVVCAKMPNGQPNLGNRWVVNGDVFATTFNNRGWTNYLSFKSIAYLNITIADLPNLLCSSWISLDSIKDLSKKIFMAYAKYSKVDLNKVQVFTYNTNPEEAYTDLGGIRDYEVTYLCKKMPNFGMSFYIRWLPTGISYIYVKDAYFDGIDYQKKGELHVYERAETYLGFEYDEDDYTNTTHSLKEYSSKINSMGKEFFNYMHELDETLSKSNYDFYTYGSREYFNSLDPEDQQKEIYDPESPYYCGHSGVYL
jgi:hypothetical protein